MHPTTFYNPDQITDKELLALYDFRENHLIKRILANSVSKEKAQTTKTKSFYGSELINFSFVSVSNDSTDGSEIPSLNEPSEQSKTHVPLSLLETAVDPVLSPLQPILNMFDNLDLGLHSPRCENSEIASTFLPTQQVSTVPISCSLQAALPTKLPQAVSVATAEDAPADVLYLIERPNKRAMSRLKDRVKRYSAYAKRNCKN